MNNVLVIKSSINGDNGNSSKLVNRFIEQLQAKSEFSITTTDLYENELTHLTQAEMGAWMTNADERTEDQKQLAAISDGYVAELQAADTVVVGLPMYNFGVPSAFKAWIDRVARAGITFRYTENGPQGLLENKKVIVLAARGGLYAGTPKDTQTNYVKDFFAFIGITDVEFVYAEGLAMGEESANAAFSQANAKIIELIEKAGV